MHCHLFKMQTQMQSGKKLPLCNAVINSYAELWHMKSGTFNIPPRRAAILKQYDKSLRLNLEPATVSLYIRNEWSAVLTVSVCTVTRDFLFASIIVSIRRSQDYFEKLFQKLLFREHIINSNFHSWKHVIIGKMQLNCFRSKIPTKSKLFAKSWLIRQCWGKCLWERYSRFRP